MSHTSSPSVQCPSGVVRVCQEWGLSRATFYHQRIRADGPSVERTKRGPKTAYTDEELTGHIRQVLMASPFLGEGHRNVNVWARLRAQGIRTSKPRVLRLMRQAGLLAPSRAPRVVGPRGHDHDGPFQSEVGHRCDQHGDGAGRARHSVRRRGSLHP
jgi:putative transposase